MKIIREIQGQTVEIELTDNEISKAHEVYERDLFHQEVYYRKGVAEVSYIEKMHAKQFADLLLSMKDNETIEFGTAYMGYEENPEEIAPDDVSGWYFVRKMYVAEYASRFLLIDYCGGEEAFVIPLNNYQEEADIEDKNLVHAEVIRYFNLCRGLSGEKFVYVERGSDL